MISYSGKMQGGNDGHYLGVLHHGLGTQVPLLCLCENQTYNNR
jgi:hypothetical protein